MSTEAFASSSFVPQSPSHWVHDSARHSCRSCRSAFSLIKRRHHCRSCREVFCDSCSSFRLKSRSRREPNLIVRVRVCQPCFMKYKGKGRSKAAKTPKVSQQPPVSVMPKQSIIKITEPEAAAVKLDSGSIPSIVVKDDQQQIWYSGTSKSSEASDSNDGDGDGDEYDEDEIPEGDEGQTEEDDDDYNYSAAHQQPAFSKFDLSAPALSLPSSAVHDVTVQLDEKNSNEKISIDKTKTEYSFTPPKTEDGSMRTEILKENSENSTLEQTEGNLPSFQQTVVSEEIKSKNEIIPTTAEPIQTIVKEQQKAAEDAVKAAGIEGSVTIATETVKVTEVVSPSSSASSASSSVSSASASSPSGSAAIFPHVDLASPNPKVPTPLLDLLNAKSPKPKEIEKLAQHEKEIQQQEIKKETTTERMTESIQNNENSSSLVQSDTMTVNMDGPSPAPVVLTTMNSGLLSPTSINNSTQWPPAPAKTNHEQNIVTNTYKVSFTSDNMKSPMSSFVISPTSSGVIVSPTSTNSLTIAEIDAENENWPDEENSVMSTKSASPIGLNALKPVPATPLATTSVNEKQSSAPLTISSVAEHSVMSTRSPSPIGLNAIYPVPATPLAANQTPTGTTSQSFTATSTTTDGGDVLSAQPRKRKIRRVVGVRKLSWAESLFHPVPAALMGVLVAILAAVLLPVTLLLLIVVTAIALVTPFAWPHVRRYIERHSNPPLAAHFDFLPKTDHEKKFSSSTKLTRPSLETVDETVTFNERNVNLSYQHQQQSSSNSVSQTLNHNNIRQQVRRPPIV